MSNFAIESSVHGNEAVSIAKTSSTKEYFLNEQEQLINQLQAKSNKLFKFTGDVLRSQYDLRSRQIVEKETEQFQSGYYQSKKQFQAYCILNRKVQKKEDQVSNLVNFIHHKNHKKTFFNAWKNQVIRNKHLRYMKQRVQHFRDTRTRRTCLKAWSAQTMMKNKAHIKNQVLEQAEHEITRIQGQYESIIKKLEGALEGKLKELKKEEEEHKILHEKYKAMYSRGKFDAI